jgi:hypothetical protein
LAVVVSSLPPPSGAEAGDPAGWSVATDARGRAFLVFVDQAGGPRLLTLGCLRDVESFFVGSTGVPGLPERGEGAGLTLTVPDADYVVYGDIAPDDDGRPSFSADLDLDAKARKAIAAQLLPVLKAPGPIVLQVANGEAQDLPLEPIPPRAGIAGPLKIFEKICFGRK